MSLWEEEITFKIQTYEKKRHQKTVLLFVLVASASNTSCFLQYQHITDAQPFPQKIVMYLSGF